MSLIEEFLKQDDPDSGYKGCKKLRDSFVKDYSVNMISALSLEDYYYAGLCWITWTKLSRENKSEERFV